MKLYASLLAVCALSGASAFQTPAPKTVGTTLNSYLGNLQGDEVATGAQYYAAADGPGGLSSRAGPGRDRQLARNIWEELTPVTVQGGSLRT